MIHAQIQMVVNTRPIELVPERGGETFVMSEFKILGQHKTSSGTITLAEGMPLSLRRIL